MSWPCPGRRRGLGIDRRGLGGGGDGPSDWCKGLLIGEAAIETRASIARCAAPAEIDHVNEMRTLHFGPADVLVTLSWISPIT